MTLARQVFPRLAALQIADGHLSDAVVLSDYVLCARVGEYGECSGFGQFGVEVLFAVMMAPFANAILHVGASVAQEQMPRIDAQSIVAVVANVLAFWYLTRSQFVTDSMRVARALGFAFRPVMNAPITGRCDGASPCPAGVFVG